MHLIFGNTVSSTVYQLYDRILNEGRYRSSRNGGCTSIFDVTLEVTNPRSRHLALEGRKSNIFAMMAETFWVMAGDDRVSPYLDFFLPRAPDYSDDGETWHGAYGPRFYAQDQLKSIPKLFVDDGLYTRRAVMTIHDPRLDSSMAIEQTYGAGVLGKDRPCNLLMNFYVDGDDQFCAKTIQRSGDAIFGTGSINPFEFSFIHELVYNEVKKNNPDLELGAYRWHVTNAHLYDFSKSQAEDALKSTDFDSYDRYDENHREIKGPSDFGLLRNFFADLVEVYTEAIQTQDERKVECLISNLGHAFLAYNVPVEDNLLWTYAQLVGHYVAAKRNVKLNAVMDISGESNEFKRSITKSSFLKFDIVA